MFPQNRRIAIPIGPTTKETPATERRLCLDASAEDGGGGSLSLTVRQCLVGDGSGGMMMAMDSVEFVPCFGGKENDEQGGFAVEGEGALVVSQCLGEEAEDQGKVGPSKILLSRLAPVSNNRRFLCLTSSGGENEEGLALGQRECSIGSSPGGNGGKRNKCKIYIFIAIVFSHQIFFLAFAEQLQCLTVGGSRSLHLPTQGRSLIFRQCQPVSLSPPTAGMTAAESTNGGTAATRIADAEPVTEGKLCLVTNDDGALRCFHRSFSCCTHSRAF